MNATGPEEEFSETNSELAPGVVPLMGSHAIRKGSVGA